MARWLSRTVVRDRHVGNGLSYSARTALGPAWGRRLLPRGRTRPRDPRGLLCRYE
jgi:hypothetical protein